MEVQHANIKIFALEPAPDDLSAAIPVFHRWIQNNVTGDMLIDVADYRHVPEGPGVMLVAHEAHYALDNTDGRLGLLYNRRVAESGDTRTKLRQAHDAALAACTRLAEEPEFQGRLKFNPGDVEVIFNDRHYTPNTPETYAALEPELEAFFAELWGDNSFEVRKVGEPRDRLRVSARVKQAELQAV
jgi:hypothetical protein